MASMCNIAYSSRTLTDPTSSQTRTTRHTSNCACNLPKNRPHTEYVFDYNSHQYNGSINPGQTLSTPSLGDEPPAVAASGTISAQRKKLQVRKTRKTRKSATQNLESLPKSQYIGSQTQSIPLHERPLLLRLQPQRLELFAQHGRHVMEHARRRLPGDLRLFQSFPGHLDNELFAAFSPL